jgi:HPt (histidine-containing phosphotransfer) domain-containing protein
LFADAAGEYARELVRSAHDHNYVALARIAHRLKGSASLYGFHQVAVAATVLEITLSKAKGSLGVKNSPHIADSALELARLCERAARRAPSSRR